MKPDWKNAPDRAQYLALDADGKWWWHEMKPKEVYGVWLSSGEVYYAGSNSAWEDTCEERPS